MFPITDVARQGVSNLMVPTSTAAEVNPENRTTAPEFEQVRLSELPEDIVIQLLQWAMAQDESEVDARALGVVSKQFNKLFEKFLDSKWYAKFFSKKIHRQATDFTRANFNRQMQSSFEYKHVNSENLSRLLAILDETHGEYFQPKRYCIAVRPENVKDFSPELLQKFEKYRGLSLPISCWFEPDCFDLVTKIVKALPEKVPVHLSAPCLWEIDSQYRLLRLIKDSIDEGRMLGIDLFYVEPEKKIVTDSILDAMCGDAIIPFVKFSGMNSDEILRDLTKRWDEFRHVQFVMVSYEPKYDRQSVRYYGRNYIDREVLKNFIGALKQRKEQGRSQITVILQAVDDDLIERDLLSSEEDRAILESISLFFVTRDYGKYLQEVSAKVAPAIGDGFIDDMKPRSRLTTTGIEKPTEKATIAVREFGLKSTEKDAGSNLSGGEVDHEKALSNQKLLSSDKISDSDSFIGSSDDDESVIVSADDSSFDDSDFDNRPRTTRRSDGIRNLTPRKPVIAANEPQLKTRGCCSII